MTSTDLPDATTAQLAAMLGTLPPVHMEALAERMGVTSDTIRNWSKAGMLRTLNICGRVYITAESLAEFNRRAAAGEFAKEVRQPPRGRVARRREC